MCISCLHISPAGGATSEDARCAALTERFADALAMRRSMIILEDADLLLACPGATPDLSDAASAADGAALSSVLLGTLRSLLREAHDEMIATTVAGTASGSSSAGIEKSGTLVVLATLSSPRAAEALRPLLASGATCIPVPMITTPEQAADALCSSSALAAVLAPEAVEHISARAVAERPISTAALREMAACACAEAGVRMTEREEDGAELADDIGAAQSRAFDLLY
mmetsp:Transcript_84828/g.169482  ORF Transcript_84828/g.169482 Transcript_84828/m.169482 type:complete len:227 (-) Transcript_84828:126-806(-)